MLEQAEENRFVVRASDALWHEDGLYYAETTAQLLQNPALPNLQYIRDRRLASLFENADLRPGMKVLEIGCGRSTWLPYLAQTHGCAASGIDVEPFAAELARANLRGAGVDGDVYCGDAFAPDQWPDLIGRFDLVFSMGVIEHFTTPVEQLVRLGRYIKPGGRVLTTVPNFRGVNDLLQRLVDIERLEMHVIYDAKRLARVHQAAGFATLKSGYVGFYEGFLSGPGPNASSLRKSIHRRICRTVNRGVLGWVRVAGDRFAPELDWLSPHVFYIGERSTTS
jgi:2-polyprenyl-3-methyl-5-hydroxy-6-metoxy-1,4-benzoquinol methylase